MSMLELKNIDVVFREKTKSIIINEYISLNISPYFMVISQSIGSTRLCVYFNYIYQNTTVTDYTPQFIKALAGRIAAEFARPITGKSAIVKEMWELYYADLAQAKISDKNRGYVPKMDKTSWVHNRRGGDRKVVPRIIR